MKIDGSETLHWGQFGRLEALPWQNTHPVRFHLSLVQQRCGSAVQLWRHSIGASCRQLIADYHPSYLDPCSTCSYSAMSVKMPLLSNILEI